MIGEFDEAAAQHSAAQREHDDFQLCRRMFGHLGEGEVDVAFSVTREMLVPHMQKLKTDMLLTRVFDALDPAIGNIYTRDFFRRMGHDAPEHVVNDPQEGAAFKRESSALLKRALLGLLYDGDAATTQDDADHPLHQSLTRASLLLVNGADIVQDAQKLIRDFSGVGFLVREGGKTISEAVHIHAQKDAGASSFRATTKPEPQG